MNKKTIGSFLRELRTEEGLTQQGLSDLLAKDYLTADYKTIGKWERGESLPEIEKLLKLGELYGVTVDEILDGERAYKDDFEKSYKLDYSHRICEEENYRQFKKIRKDAKEYLLSCVSGSLTLQKKRGLDYLLKTYFNNGREKLDLASLYRDIRKSSIGINDKEEKWWEIQKLLRPVNLIRFHIGALADNGFSNKTVAEYLDLLEDWEKDMLLCSLQYEDPIFYDPTTYSQEAINRYEKMHGAPFNRELLTKNLIRFLVGKGAMINSSFLGYFKGDKLKEEPIIDTVEKLYSRVKEPIRICINDDGKLSFFYAENTRENQALLKHWEEITAPMMRAGYSLKEIIDLRINNGEPPLEVLYRVGKADRLITKEEDVKFQNKLPGELLLLKDRWINQYSALTSQRDHDQSDLDFWVEQLQNDESSSFISNLHQEGGTNLVEREEWIIGKAKEMRYEDFLSSRKRKITERMVADLDRLPMSKIREKYFIVGCEEDE